MPELFPVWDAPDLVEEEQETVVQYGRSVAFDFEKGDFVLDGAGRVKETDGHTAWAYWCIKTVTTQRFAYLVYEPEHGTELEEAMSQPTRAAREAELARAITEALMADIRTESVRDCVFDHAGDELLVSFTAVPTIGTPVRLEVSLNG